MSRIIERRPGWYLANRLDRRVLVIERFISSVNPDNITYRVAFVDEESHEEISGWRALSKSDLHILWEAITEGEDI